MRNSRQNFLKPNVSWLLLYVFPFLAVPGAHQRASAASQAILCTIVGLELSLGNIAVGRVVGAAGHHGLRDKVPQDVAGKQVIAHLMN